MKWWSNVSRVLLAGLLAFPLAAQRDQVLLRELTEENRQSVEALILYPEEVRLAILESTREPAVLVKMQSLRLKTNTAFTELIQDVPRSAQEVLYDITRYPGLLTELVQTRGDQQAMKWAVEVMPEQDRSRTCSVANQYMGLLQQADALYRSTEQAFESVIATLPEPTRLAFRKLKETPEVVDILNEDLRFTVMVGDLYSEDPAWVLHKMDSLHLAVAQAHAAELQVWKETIENDPEAKEEFIEASRVYAATYYGYDSEDYPYPEYDPDDVLVEMHYIHHYPYWFGYPWWYDYPRWRPYPYWYDWGFFYHRNTFVILFMPTHHFMGWYFGHPHHHHSYNHLSARFVSHYYYYQNSGSTLSVGVDDWRNRTRTIISDQWLQDQNRLPDRMREYGDFEEGRQRYNAQHPDQKKAPEEFLDANRQKYPGLQQSREEAREIIRREETVPRRQPAPVKKQEPVRPLEPTRPPRPETERKQDPVRTLEPAKKPAEVPLDKARDYHRERWETAKPRQEPTKPAQTVKPSKAPRTQPAPRVKTAPQKAPQKAPEQKKRGGGR